MQGACFDMNQQRLKNLLSILGMSEAAQIPTVELLRLYHQVAPHPTATQVLAFVAETLARPQRMGPMYMDREVFLARVLLAEQHAA